MKGDPAGQISVLMPTYNQARYIPRAIASLLRQTVSDWELILVDDGSTDTTAAAVRPFLGDTRVRYHRLPRNRGIGAALQNPEVLLAYAGVRHHYNCFADGQIDGHPLQLVQVMHRCAAHRWVERETLVTDDLDRLYWSTLRQQGPAIGTGRVTCEWVDHGPYQHHKLI